MLAIVVGGPVPFLVLIVGVSLAATAMLGYVVYKINFAPIKDGESDAVRAARLRRAQDKLYKRGAARTSRSRTISLALVGKVRTLTLTQNPGLSLSLGQTLTLTLTLTGQSQDEPCPDHLPPCDGQEAPGAISSGGHK